MACSALPDPLRLRRISATRSSKSNQAANALLEYQNRSGLVPLLHNFVTVERLKHGAGHALTTCHLAIKTSILMRVHIPITR